MSPTSSESRRCVTCGTDISDKRIDARFCGDRCRVHFGRQEKKREMVDELLNICSRIPNDTVQCGNQVVGIWQYNAERGSYDIISKNQLLTCSEDRLKELLKSKKAQFLGLKLQQWFQSK